MRLTFTIMKYEHLFIEATLQASPTRAIHFGWTHPPGHFRNGRRWILQRTNPRREAELDF